MWPNIFGYYTEPPQRCSTVVLVVFFFKIFVVLLSKLWIFTSALVINPPLVIGRRSSFVKHIVHFYLPIEYTAFRKNKACPLPPVS